MPKSIEKTRVWVIVTPDNSLILSTTDTSRKNCIQNFIDGKAITWGRYRQMCYRCKRFTLKLWRLS